MGCGKKHRYRECLGLLLACVLLSGCAESGNALRDEEEQKQQEILPADKGEPEELHSEDEAEDENAEAEMPEDVEDWRKVYLEYMNTAEVQSMPHTCSLIYVDEDDIPELVLDTGIEADGCQILTYHEGALDVLQTSRLYFDYIERGNLLCNADGNMGFYYNWVYTIQDGVWEMIASGEQFEKEDAKPGEDGEILYDYLWNQRLVTEEEFERRLAEVYDQESAITPEKYEIQEEMISLLATGEALSEHHRYELIVEDVTWTEAQERCLAQGGYLAVITSQEEFSRIEAQLISEERTGVTFWVGAKNPREDGAWGYRWIQQGQLADEYEMVFYGNVYSSFWLDGEPSYEGQTESGETVQEDCVDLFYRSSEGRCYLNDVPDDILSAAPAYAGRIGYICEYDE